MTTTMNKGPAMKTVRRAMGALVLAAMCAMPAVAAAQVPSTMIHQGRLLDRAGAPSTGIAPGASFHGSTRKLFGYEAQSFEVMPCAVLPERLRTDGPLTTSAAPPPAGMIPACIAAEHKEESPE
jgi:hypothetical protein